MPPTLSPGCFTRCNEDIACRRAEIPVAAAPKRRPRCATVAALPDGAGEEGEETGRELHYSRNLMDEAACSL